MKKITARKLIEVLEGAIAQGTITPDTHMAVGSAFNPHDERYILDESTKVIPAKIKGREYGLLLY